MLEGLPEDITKHIVLLAYNTKVPTSDSLSIEQVCTTWQKYILSENILWENFLAVHPNKKTAKQTFFQNPSYRYPQFFSKDTIYNMTQNWKIFVSELSEACISNAKITHCTDKESLSDTLEFFLKQHSFKQEMLVMLTKPATPLWKQLTLLDVNLNILTFFVEFHPESTPLLLLSKDQKIIHHIYEDLLRTVLKYAPKYCSLVLENPHTFIQKQVDTYLKYTANEAIIKYSQQVESRLSHQNILPGGKVEGGGGTEAKTPRNSSPNSRFL